MTRRPANLFSSVAAFVALAGALALLQANPALDPAAGGAWIDDDVASPAAPRADFDPANTDYAPPRGVVDPPVGHAARRAAETSVPR